MSDSRIDSALPRDEGDGRLLHAWPDRVRVGRMPMSTFFALKLIKHARECAVCAAANRRSPPQGWCKREGAGLARAYIAALEREQKEGRRGA